jgi:hypothetical protein
VLLLTPINPSKEEKEKKKQKTKQNLIKRDERIQSTLAKAKQSWFPWHLHRLPLPLPV